MSERRTGSGARRLVIADYVQYIALAAGVLLLFVFVRQIADVILIFLAAAILAYVLNPVVKRVERLGAPRARCWESSPRSGRCSAWRAWP